MIPRGENAMHATGNLTATARAGFGPEAPQMPLWSPWLERKGGKGQGESERIGPGW